MKNSWIIIGMFILFISCNEKKSGFVQGSKLYNEFAMTKELTKNLEINTQVKNQILDSLKLNIKQLEMKLNATPTDELLQQYELKKQEYLYKSKLFNEETQSLQQTYTEQSLTQINQYIMEFGKAHQYEYIFGANGNGSIMYADEQNDITEQVLTYVNDKYQGK